MDLYQRLHERYGLSSEALHLLETTAERQLVGRKECVVREGERNPWLYFVEEGAVRTFVMREERCVILNFAFEGDPVTSSLGGTDDYRARVTIETLEASTLVRLRRSEMEQLFRQSVELANWGRCVAERFLNDYEEYFTNYSWRDKGEQYLRLLAQYPDLLQRVPLKDLASFLLVTPQTLSRIRAEVRWKLP